MLKFKTSDGTWHLGDYANAPVSDNPGYEDEGGHWFEPDTIIEKQTIICPRFYYWNVTKREYELISVHPDRRSDGEQLLADIPNVVKETLAEIDLFKFKDIRESLLLNGKCKKDVYIDSDFAINSVGSISIECEDSNLPSIVKEGLKKGRQNIPAESILLYAQIKQAKADILYNKEWVSNTDNQGERKTTRRKINELEASIKSLKDKIAYNNSIEQEFNIAYSKKD